MYSQWQVNRQKMSKVDSFDIEVYEYLLDDVMHTNILHFARWLVSVAVHILTLSYSLQYMEKYF